MAFVSQDILHFAQVDACETLDHIQGTAAWAILGFLGGKGKAMIGLINAIGLGSSVRAAGAARRDHDNDSRYGIQVPIPLAQREEASERASAVQALDREGSESGPLARDPSRASRPSDHTGEARGEGHTPRPPPHDPSDTDAHRGHRLDVEA